MEIREGGLDDPRVVALLERHVTRAHAETAAGSAHALGTDGLKAPGIRFWSAWDGETLLGFGALKRLDRDHGEVKSMHTAEAARGQGVATAVLARITAEARAMGLTRISLETGSWDYFAPARAFYAKAGFVPCAPFGDYRPDRNSVFLTLAL
jgi:putative acetyltransferase